MGSGLRRRGRPRFPGLFTPAEERVLAGLERELTYQQIADELEVSYDTVKYHVSNMLSKAGVESRTELVRYAKTHRGRRRIRAGWLVPLAASIVAGVAVLAAVAVLVVRFGADDEAEPDAVATEVPTANVTSTISPTVAATVTAVPSAVPQTGVSVVDAFIAAMLSGDVAALEALVDYGEIGCVAQPQGIGSPPMCEAGVAEGTLVKVIGFSNCEGGYGTETDVLRSLEFFTSAGPRLFSVSRRSGGGYAVLFTLERWSDGATRQGAATGTAFMLSDSGLQATVSGCGTSIRTLAASYPDYLIVPPSPGPVPAGTRHTGITDLDAVIDALVLRDTPTLASSIVFARVGCGSDRWLPRCPEGKPAGTLVDAVTLRACEPAWLGPFDAGQPIASNGVSLGEVANIVDNMLGPTPEVIAVARDDGTDLAGVAYWLVYDASFAPGQPDGGHGLGLNESGGIVVFDRGCNETPEAFAARYSDFLLPPK